MVLLDATKTTHMQQMNKNGAWAPRGKPRRGSGTSSRLSKPWEAALETLRGSASCGGADLAGTTCLTLLV